MNIVFQTRIIFSHATFSRQHFEIKNEEFGFLNEFVWKVEDKSYRKIHEVRKDKPKLMPSNFCGRR